MTLLASFFFYDFCSQPVSPASSLADKEHSQVLMRVCRHEVTMCLMSLRVTSCFRCSSFSPFAWHRDLRPGSFSVPPSGPYMREDYRAWMFKNPVQTFIRNPKPNSNVYSSLQFKDVAHYDERCCFCPFPSDIKESLCHSSLLTFDSEPMGPCMCCSIRAMLGGA